MGKKILISLGIIVLIVILFIAGVNALGYHIFSRTDCEFFNIDNIELRTGINIPAIVDSDCKSNGKIKEASFSIDTSKVDLKAYSLRNNFACKDSVYLNEWETDKTKWVATLNQESGILKIKMEYKD